MKYATATIAAVTMALVSAKDCNLPPISEAVVPGDVFKLVALPKVANEIECQPFQAKNNDLLIGDSFQSANCTTRLPRAYASFVLNSQGLLFLYTGDTPDNFEAQEIFVDRSGMGQGNIQYTTGLPAKIGSNQQVGPFKITETSDLVFDDGNGAVTAFQACPPANGDKLTGWKVWLAGNDKPAGSEGCVELNARAVKDTTPEACEYSVYSA
ncbi:hypothetical protein COCC4DRAFT_46016 [Bipolaris maydis ATCC 48331]|uniref:Cell wall protein PhiA n=1 Tax=Cochliobolus heterostrophus (strain C4 / ATCC 48331 / race T) TaxID=665024 RepID=N4WVT7_COCH4|nr:uncharacterized protein COCC4DRAFT_46016 [Bipolaris maydis ATCC 48331]KAJ5027512.1 hypothetical protein J3E73DRAFT_210843 [Bipolaris maydis]ENH98500.1 hypothetical protein COCC4DRAFT_46016 [Bipolaris maydis ATCC 48331]KAJ5058697.1 hypothetical protein J3E74DRAFT_273440 [Bipolaris maydis]KAJ6202298.1 hypothetical protein J3E72DRAFT_427129 [Bipolaris maydis]KAJ6208678.1 hypothetical protein PSV09DRAFT_2433909 [Bipolaris maydis]